jgi:sarcosine oxidase, subunit gamma
MSDSTRQETPLVERNSVTRRQVSTQRAGLTVRERPYLAYVNLRGDAGISTFTDGVRKATGVDLPTEPNTVAEEEACRALWLGPDEWYIVAEAGREVMLVDALEKELAGGHFAVNDLTSALTTLELKGPQVRDVLAKGCTLDLHPWSFGPGQCAQTLVAHAGILIRHVDAEPTFEITVRRSFADYFWVWLEDAALEYGMAVTD